MARSPIESEQAYGRRVVRAWQQVRLMARGRIELLRATLEVPQPRRQHKNLLVRSEFEFDVRCFNSRGEWERTYSIFAETKEDFDRWIKTVSYITDTLAEFLKRKAEAEAKKPEGLQKDAEPKRVEEEVVGLM